MRRDQPPRELVRTFACPKCGAAAGEPCIGARRVPQPRISHHQHRVNIARAALERDPMRRY